MLLGPQAESSLKKKKKRSAGRHDDTQRSFMRSGRGLTYVEASYEFLTSVRRFRKVGW